MSTFRKITLLFSLCSLLLGSVPVSVNAAGLPNLGDGGEMSVSQERDLGDQVARQIYKDPDNMDDPLLLDYVNGILQTLRAAARTRGVLSEEQDSRLAWQVFLLRDPTVNAFALPGAYFGVHLGLIALVSSRDELASVLAHETSHVTQRHIVRLIAREKQQMPWIVGALLLGALGARGNGDVAQAAIVGSQAAAIQDELNFSRDMEREADRMGFNLMQPAGFEPGGFASMFDKLDEASRFNDTTDFPYLRNHPLTTERIGDMKNRLQLSHLPLKRTSFDVLQAMMSARAKILVGPGVDALRTLQHDPKGPLSIEQAGAWYAAALASLKLGEPKAAEHALKALQDLHIDDEAALRVVGLLEVEVALSQKQFGRAYSALTLHSRALRSAPELSLLAQIQTQSGKAYGAAEAITTWLAEHPRNAGLWTWLSAVYEAENKPLQSTRAAAEAYAVWFDYAGAVDRLRVAQNLARQMPANQRTPDYEIQVAIIDARLHALQELLREQRQEDAKEKRQ